MAAHDGQCERGMPDDPCGCAERLAEHTILSRSATVRVGPDARVLDNLGNVVGRIVAARMEGQSVKVTCHLDSGIQMTGLIGPVGFGFGPKVSDPDAEVNP